MHNFVSLTLAKLHSYLRRKLKRVTCLLSAGVVPANLKLIDGPRDVYKDCQLQRQRAREQYA
jgi:hypothetical protein